MRNADFVWSFSTSDCITLSSLEKPSSFTNSDCADDDSRIRPTTLLHNYLHFVVIFNVMTIIFILDKIPVSAKIMKKVTRSWNERYAGWSCNKKAVVHRNWIKPLHSNRNILTRNKISQTCDSLPRWYKLICILALFIIIIGALALVSGHQEQQSAPANHWGSVTAAAASVAASAAAAASTSSNWCCRCSAWKTDVWQLTLLTSESLNKKGKYLTISSQLLKLVQRRALIRLDDIHDLIELTLVTTQNTDVTSLFC